MATTTPLDDLIELALQPQPPVEVISAAELRRQYNTVVDRLARWVVDHAAQIERVFYEFPPGQKQVLLTVIQRSARFDLDFSREAARFESELARDRTIRPIAVEVVVLPLGPVVDQGEGPGLIEFVINGEGHQHGG